MAAKLVPDPLELRAKLASVVDLTVIGDDKPARSRLHRLRAGRTEIDDREPRMAQRHTRLLVHPDALRIWPAMAQSHGHACGKRLQLVVAGAPLWITKSRNSAHLEAPRLRSCHGLRDGTVAHPLSSDPRGVSGIAPACLL